MSPAAAVNPARTVTTVLGPVAADALGSVMAHEHVLFDTSHYYAPPADGTAPAPGPGPDREWLLRHPMNARDNLLQRDEAVARAELAAYTAVGGRTLVDQTTCGIGPRPRALAALSRATGVHVVAGTGFYVAGSYPEEIRAWDEARIADHLRRELLEGIDGTDVRAGIIGELGLSTAPSPGFERRLLRASARVQAELGCAVAIHTPAGRDAVLTAAREAQDAGLDPARTALCHLDNRFGDDLDAYAPLARAGFTLSLDCFGRECYYAHLGAWLPSDETRIRAVLGLIERGLADRVVLSQDICFRHELLATGGHGYGHVLRSVAPRMRALGATDADLDRLLVGNPRAWLAG